MNLSLFFYSISHTFLCFSTIAAATIAAVDKTSPIPILWRLVIPRTLCVIFRAMGMNSFSFSEVNMRIVMKRKAEKEPAGTVKELPSFRSMIVACSTVKVVIWE